MSQAILDALVKGGAPLLGQDTLQAYLEDGSPQITALFFTGDPDKRAETADVAVAIREVVKAHQGELRLALVDRADEAALMKTHGVTTLPSVAFFKGPRPIEIIARIQNWSVYEEKIPHILARARGSEAGTIPGETNGHAQESAAMG